MEGRLKDKVIVVAGAGGIGSGLARRYAAEGAAVVVGDLDEYGARTLATEIVESGGRAAGTHLDGGEDASIKALVDLAISNFGGLDGFHANYACFKDGESGEDILGLPMEVYDEVMDVNARGFVLCTRHALPHMLARGGGSMVYTTTGGAYQGEPVRCAYAMSKSAVHALVRHVARRFGPQGIRANAIAPGVIAHGRFHEALPEEVKASLKETNLVKTFGKPEDIAAMGALLMADEGSFITGQVISVDGGGLMRP
jgi:NAD(P)-dependent dehydrogenase (short-subunit alcohol dehydrogenase family)